MGIYRVTSVKYKMNNKSMAAFLLSDSVGDCAEAHAKEIALIAQATAPRSSGPGPHMADQYEVARRIITAPTVPARNPRQGAIVFNEDPAAAPNEFGTRRNKRRRTLAVAGSMIGKLRGGTPG